MVLSALIRKGSYLIPQKEWVPKDVSRNWWKAHTPYAKSLKAMTNKDTNTVNVLLGEMGISLQ